MAVKVGVVLTVRIDWRQAHEGRQSVSTGVAASAVHLAIDHVGNTPVFITVIHVTIVALIGNIGNIRLR